MTGFTSALRLEPQPQSGLYRTTRPLEYEIGLKGSGLRVTVPTGFETDLASVPRFLWPIFAPHDPRYAAAAVLHDCLYRWDGFTRVVADAVFYEAMRALGTPRWKAKLMYIAVRLANRWR